MVMVMVVGVVKKEENIFNIECYLVSVKISHCYFVVVVVVGYTLFVPSF